MARATQALTTGMKILGGGNAPAFTLEHLTGSAGHKAGSFETIVIPYIELGRDRSCAVQFDEPTVSRKHASIERKGDEVIIKNLSTTNPTLVNGRPVKNQFFLNNGDEIQLSMEGPRLRYNVSATGTAKMGVTKRMNLVMQQAVKPYRTAVMSLAAAFVILAGVGGFFIYDGMKKTDVLAAENQELVKEAQRLDSLQKVQQKQQKQAMDSLTKVHASEMGKLKNANQKLQGILADMDQKLNDQLDSLKVSLEAPNTSGALSGVYQDIKDHVYFMQVQSFTVTYPDGYVEDINSGWICTGFMVDDGKFITARHCVQGWRFLAAGNSPESDIMINAVEQMGAKFDIEILCTSTKGSFTISASDFVVDDSHDEMYQVEDGQGGYFDVKVAQIDRYDWAYANVGDKTNFKYDTDLCYNLNAGDELVILGFSYGIGGSSSSSQVKPLLSKSLVAQDGVNDVGSISLTDRNFGGGNSGGPVIKVGKNGATAVGIVSAGTGDEIGFIVPIGEIK